MGEENFKNHYLGSFEISERDRFLAELGAEYHRRCDAYDDTVCSGARDGVSVPRTLEEFGQINRNARIVMDDLIQRAAQRGIGRDDVIKAIQGAAR